MTQIINNNKNKSIVNNILEINYNIFNVLK